MNKFIKASLIRAVRTMCQTAIAVIGSATVMSAVDWRVTASSVLLAGILSILTSVSTGLPEVDMMDTDDVMDYLEDEEGEIDE